MENFNYVIEGDENDCLEQLEFSCENNFIGCDDFTSNDVERVLMEGHESILSTIEPMGCQDTSPFLSEMTDILGDISELNNTFCGTNDMPTCSQLPEQEILSEFNDLNCSWPLSDPISFISVPADMNTQDNITNDSGFFNISSGSNTQVLLPGNTIEYPHSECSYLNADYPSSFNQLFQNFDQPQFSFISTPVNSIEHPPSTTHTFSDAFLNTIGSLPASTTITPITGEDRQVGTLSPVKQELIVEARFTDEGQSDSENFAPLSELASQVLPVHNYIPQLYDESIQSENRVKCESAYSSDPLHYTSPMPSQQHKVIAVLNENQCSQMGAPLPICGSVPHLSDNLCLVSQKIQSPPAMNISTSTAKHPPELNWTTVFPRKHFNRPPEMLVMHPLRTRRLMPSRRPVIANTPNLSEYFDTSSINIPVIRERPRPEGKNENRRKQKLNVIPGAENFVFEIQRNEQQHSEVTASVADGNRSLERDPYPETELPELEEIFKRKKKHTATTFGTKRSSLGFPIVSGVAQKKHCLSNIQESSNSFDEKASVSIAIRQTRSKIINRIDFSSESDSVTTDEEMPQPAKSLKCLKCMKLFKTPRSLAIHIKRCTVKEIDSANLSNVSLKNVLKVHKDEDIVKSSDGHKTEKGSHEYSKRIKLIDSVHDVKERPITRSQTKRSFGHVIGGPTISKRAK